MCIMNFYSCFIKNLYAVYIEDESDQIKQSARKGSNFYFELLHIFLYHFFSSVL